jgi:protein ImuB
VPATTTDLTDPDDTAQRLRPRLDAGSVAPSRTGTRRRAKRAAGTGPTLRDTPFPGSLPSPSPSIVLDDATRAVVTDKEGAVVVVGGRGELNATPVSLVIGEREPQEITGWAGPWPVDEWWWDERRHRRLARFQVVTADGAAHLVAVERQRWWVLASYG